MQDNTIAVGHCSTPAQGRPAGHPGQDFATSGVANGRIYGVVSDGCSSSKGRPERGAQLIAETVAQLLANSTWEPCFEPAFHSALLQRMSDALAARELDIEDLLATCVAFCVDRETVRFWVCGDGAFAVLTPEGELLLNTFEWSGNAPLYPAYHLVPELVDKLRDPNAKRAVRHTVTKWTVTDANELLLEGIRTKGYSAESMLTGLVAHLPASQVWRVGVFSDGLMQVTGCPGSSVAAHLLAFPAKGQQAVRDHGHRVLNVLREQGHRLSDDLAAAVAQLQLS